MLILRYTLRCKITIYLHAASIFAHSVSRNIEYRKRCSRRSENMAGIHIIVPSVYVMAMKYCHRDNANENDRAMNRILWLES